MMKSESSRGRPTVDEERARVSKDQRALLDEFWKHFTEKGSWPLVRSVYSPNRTKFVCDTLRPLTGNIVREERGQNGKPVFSLSVLGVLLTANGERLQQLAQGFLTYQHEVFKTRPEDDMVKAKDVATFLRISKEESEVLGQLIAIRNSSGSVPGRKEPDWTAQVLTEAERFPDGDLSEQVDEWVMRYYDPTAAVFEEDRRNRVGGSAIGSSPLLGDYLSTFEGFGRNVDRANETSAYKRRYQVFISSTYQDLIDEREQVVRALLAVNCIPSGMELFPAAGNSKWDLIRQFIDGCDYFVVIVAGKYGSIDSSGKSFTEQEFDYARSVGKPILGFYHADPSSLPGSRLESTDAMRANLARFTEKVKAELVCQSWNSADGLASGVKSSIFHAIASQPKPGWVRADTVPSWGMVKELQERVAHLEGRGGNT